MPAPTVPPAPITPPGPASSSAPVPAGDSHPPLHGRPGLPFAAGLLVVLALFGVLVVLGASTDWWSNDESYTWDLIQHPARQIVKGAASDVHPPLHYLVLRVWRTLLPQPRGMRVFSMLTGLVALASVALIGRRFGGARLGLLTALLWAAFPLFLHHCQEGRMYAMALCCETVALLGWAIGDLRPRLGWLLLVLGLLAAFYTHNHCLIFGAALVGGELLHSLWARRQGAPEALRGPAPRWILSVALIVALGYLPWFFVLLRQVRSDYFRQFYQSPTWAVALCNTFYYPYNMNSDGYHNPWGWLPGVALLGLLPALWLLRELARIARNIPSSPTAPAPRFAMVAWVGAAPFVFLVGYSMFVDPMFAITRHGLLFIPFLLFPSASWLSSFSHRLPGRVAALLALGVAALLSLAAMRRPRDADYRPYINALNDRAPLDAPIVLYPPAYNYTRLMWSPLQLKIHELNSGEDRLTSCTLVASHLIPGHRDDIDRQVRRTLAKADSVRAVYSSYELSAWHLTGLPHGVIESLLWREPGSGADYVEQMVGRWLPGKNWGGRDLQNLMRPAGELTPFLPLNPDSIGVRLDAPRTALTLPAADSGAAAFAAIMVGCHYVPGGTELASPALDWSMNDGPSDEKKLGSGAFLLARIAECAASPTRIALNIPESVARRRHIPRGDAMPGVYVAWAGVRALRPEDCNRPGFKGEYFDVGALGDELFLRSGFNDAEGAPGSDVRWTQDRFAVELPIWPGDPVREVVLIGMLPAAAPTRTISMTVTSNATGRQFKTQAAFPRSDYGEYVLQLPEALGPGVYRFEFTAGVFSPQASGQGNDSRRLGFFLAALGLR